MKHSPRGRIKARPEADPNLMDAVKPLDASYTSCTATSKQSGQRCKRRPIRGGTVCVIHGGGSPQVKLKAQERLAALVDPAITRLAELIAQTTYPSTAYAAVRDALDRGLGKPVEQQIVEHKGGIRLIHELPD